MINKNLKEYNQLNKEAKRRGGPDGLRFYYFQKGYNHRKEQEHPVLKTFIDAIFSKNK